VNISEDAIHQAEQAAASSLVCKEIRSASGTDLNMVIQEGMDTGKQYRIRGARALS